ncbi:MAG: response regulator transcription factor [Zymomonas mobilis subsp. pomaceae]|uniref:Regulatory protein VirG n=1 Tax=Zymomonas mobilis subsp. pomaceae (strain ATCC 29192 / DSM 22645 / JCM 10191 / CCUG 17912 / NBRC 13757 / NCIMB 11200 / NRRL B-4491 / Barker I) TaxID=579138 RepID=F8ETL9_ZYMMT|nr:response regulator transcription factor [Zymomonas mobilis]AEI37029.1 two component transcriptional regulator, winged helix family [Zymomonas mobilis subsp. pomaceae ATCC 29192]MDX5948401.1 response regulator transcription factor [Zymomonas mobilis subsp. pomaceae]GEB89609.1 DNA-binding response regulator [Zymomonas mobilis subsp. pomaceae]
MASQTIMIVEDDASLRALIARVLKENGYAPCPVGCGEEMWEELKDRDVDLILMDVMLPGKNGLDLTRELRSNSHYMAIPVVFLSARDDETDRVVGLELGGDDYIPKPFGKKELVARVRAVLRRSQIGKDVEEPISKSHLIRFEGWVLDPDRRELHSPTGAGVELSGAEFDLLLSFSQHAQRVIGRERLLELSRSRLSEASDRSIDVLVSRLRRKLSGQPGSSDMIRTIRGVGYMFTVPVVQD